MENSVSSGRWPLHHVSLILKCIISACHNLAAGRLVNFFVVLDCIGILTMLFTPFIIRRSISMLFWDPTNAFHNVHCKEPNIFILHQIVPWQPLLGIP